MTTNTWVVGSTDWNAPGSYLENSVPGEGDCVFVPSGVEAAVKVESAADEEGLADFNVFSRLAKVVLADSSSSLSVDLGEGLSLTNGCGIVGKNEGSGKIVKRGKGMLEFGCQENSAYDLDISVEGGTLVFPQDIPSGSFNVRAITVAAEATLITAADEAKANKLAAAPTLFSELWGEGTVSNRYSGKRLNFRMHSKPSTFAGTLGDGLRLYPGEPGELNLTGESSTMTYDPAVSGGATLGFSKMGMKNMVSSLGASSKLYWRGDNCVFRYLGSGEVSDRNLLMWSESKTAIFDGGPNGGLTLTGTISADAAQGANAQGMHRLILTGSNTVPCVVAGALPTWTILETNYNFHVTKAGPGTWRFTDAERTHAGGWTVADGTLQFDSLKDRGNACALGTSTNTMEDYAGLIEEAKRVDWAFALGASGTAGTFEYTGTKDVWCDSRPVIMRGDGTLSVTNKDVRFRFANVSADSGVSARLTLAGSNTNECSLVNATDGEGTLSIAKSGPGTWYLEGQNSFSGSLSVKEGTLVVRNPADYSWWRWTVQQTYAEYTDLYAQAQEFCLFDADNKRVNGYLAQVSGQTAYESVGPGEVAYHRYGQLGGNDYTRPLKNLFNDGDSDASGGQHWVFAWYTNGVQVARPMLDDPSTWIPIIMRLPENSQRVCSYDMVHVGAADSGRNVDTFRLEGSVDGVNWNVLTNVTGAKSAGQNTWLFTRAKYSAGGAAEHSGGAAVSGGPETVGNPLANVSSVSVAAGAVLKAEGAVTIPALAVDAAGAGVIDGFSFATAGTLAVANLPDAGSVTLPAVFRNCTGLENVANWSLSVDGRTSSKVSAAVRDGKIMILKTGFSVIIR